MKKITLNLNITFTKLVGAFLIIASCLLSFVTKSSEYFLVGTGLGVSLILGQNIGTAFGKCKPPQNPL
jgi:hypothetical protein